ncbi:MAG: hypothetical protein A3C61_01020 [Candidatus Yanofskybacteria bacterium RIFCSPHIGHO2_02_FULL_39_10]|uniref:Uncharacterized protein n=1 Tax=Candidatus Yanofskybacteria bacterium RIFCSPHIGHO2_02_FULL_39_10 TaxID=1802674 RepID=A0A1F8F4S0_9BACT|nr:MAG: hypothetical protein A3C61_01020 [Candidatus Yanofskybacteria bacterium RIFCSPHIGHO2_02_FULL_39_10]
MKRVAIYLLMVALIPLVGTISGLYGYVHGYEKSVDGVLISTGQVDLLSLRAIAYYRSPEHDQHLFECISIKKVFGEDEIYSFVDSRLNDVIIGSSFIKDPKTLARYEKRAYKLLEETQNRFSDTMKIRGVTGGTRG